MEDEEIAEDEEDDAVDPMAAPTNLPDLRSSAAAKVGAQQYGLVAPNNLKVYNQGGMLSHARGSGGPAGVFQSNSLM